jgi:hypothetical protein
VTKGSGTARLLAALVAGACATGCGAAQSSASQPSPSPRFVYYYAEPDKSGHALYVIDPHGQKKLIARTCNATTKFLENHFSKDPMDLLAVSPNGKWAVTATQRKVPYPHYPFTEWVVSTSGEGMFEGREFPRILHSETPQPGEASWSHDRPQRLDYIMWDAPKSSNVHDSERRVDVPDRLQPLSHKCAD